MTTKEFENAKRDLLVAVRLLRQQVHDTNPRYGTVNQATKDLDERITAREQALLASDPVLKSLKDQRKQREERVKSVTSRVERMVRLVETQILASTPSAAGDMVELVNGLIVEVNAFVTALSEPEPVKRPAPAARKTARPSRRK